MILLNRGLTIRVEMESFVLDVADVYRILTPSKNSCRNNLRDAARAAMAPSPRRIFQQGPAFS